MMQAMIGLIAKWAVILLLSVTVLLVVGEQYDCYYRGSDDSRSDLCANSATEATTSPDGCLRAVVFKRECDATTSVSMQVSVLSAKEWLPYEAGNVFGLNRNHRPSTSLDVHVRWIGPRELLIRYDRMARSWSQGAKYTVQMGLLDLFERREVSIKYEPVSRVTPF